MNWAGIIVLSLVIVVSIFFIGKFAYHVITSNGEGKAEAKVESPPETAVASNFQPVSKESEASEYEFQQTLHKMTHQKVYAEEKWGLERITDEKIDEMLKVAKESKFKNKDFYIEVLSLEKR